MTDGTLIIGLAGLAGTTIIGPLVAYQVRKDEDGRRQTAVALDEAIDAMTRARASVNWIDGLTTSSAVLRQVPLAPELTLALQQGLAHLYDAEAYATRLHLRLGQCALTEAYADTVGQLGDLSSDLYERAHGRPSATQNAFEVAQNKLEVFVTSFIEQARRWHQDHYGQ
jgi:hypothetical protein